MSTEVNYHDIAEGLAALIVEKQKSYGDSFTRSAAVMEVLYPNGISPAQYKDSLTIVRIVDKLFRIATDPTALGEDPWLDIAGYSLLSLGRIGNEKKIIAKKEDREAIAKVIRDVGSNTYPTVSEF